SQIIEQRHVAIGDRALRAQKDDGRGLGFGINQRERLSMQINQLLRRNRFGAEHRSEKENKESDKPSVVHTHYLRQRKPRPDILTAQTGCPSLDTVPNQSYIVKRC